MTATRIVNRVAALYGLRFRDLRARTRVAIIAEARSIACYLIRMLTGMSYPAIGRMMRRDHTTIMSACRSVARKLERWPDGPTALAVAQAREALG